MIIIQCGANTVFRYFGDPNVLQAINAIRWVQYQQMKGSKLGNRILFLSPSVQAGWEKQSHRLDFNFVEELGKGSFGVVHRAIHKKSKNVYAIKQIKKSTLNNPKLIEHAKTEVKIMYSLNHNNIIKLYNHFEDELSIYLVLEYASKGQLYLALKNSPGRKFTQEVAANYISQVTQGIQEIHRQKIMHRDIKPENILITEGDTLKVADFGWSHFVSFEDRTTFCGTLDYLAPEMLEKGHKHDYRVDVWSIGVLVYELCTGDSPFTSELIRKKMMSEDRVKNNIKKVAYTIPEFLSPECQDLIKKILVYSVEERPSTTEILAHPWFSKNHSPVPEKDSQWLESLTSQMKDMFPEVTDNSSQSGFSKDEIYKYTRPDSIINLRPQRHHKKKIEQTHIEHSCSSPESSSTQKLEPATKNAPSSDPYKRIQQLQQQHLQDQQLIKQLKQQLQKSRDHRECKQQLRSLMDTVLQQNKDMENLARRLAESESKLFAYERKNRGV